LLLDNNATYTTDQVVVGTGAKVVILAAILTVINPGDKVVIPAPYWVTYPDRVEMARGVSVFVPCDESTGFKLTPCQVQKRAFAAHSRCYF
jgi:aspartate aminotransferase